MYTFLDIIINIFKIHNFIHIQSLTLFCIKKNQTIIANLIIYYCKIFWFQWILKIRYFHLNFSLMRCLRTKFNLKICYLINPLIKKKHPKSRFFFFKWYIILKILSCLFFAILINNCEVYLLLSMVQIVFYFTEVFLQSIEVYMFII